MVTLPRFALMVACLTDTPVTRPELLMVITEVLLLLQEDGYTSIPLQSTPLELHCMDSPMGQKIGSGLKPKLLSPQQLMQPPVAPPRLLPRQLHQPLTQRFIAPCRAVAKTRYRDRQQPANPLLARLVILSQPAHFSPQVHEPHPFFEITAFSISLSRLKSATSFFNR